MIDMEMPRSCEKCRFASKDSGDWLCYATENGDMVSVTDATRPSWCPLISTKREKWFKVEPSK